MTFYIKQRCHLNLIYFYFFMYVFVTHYNKLNSTWFFKCIFPTFISLDIICTSNNYPDNQHHSRDYTFGKVTDDM